ncbi:ABC transporter ATP-binding protein [Paenibacillus sp. N1-5-1-14]|uniref:ABC transporter ATP-binding protein n=1 Tax=Paenibacillus radicibacter TaxID=2972488 RepID=UPI002158F201|nr:ABC transporter ATP-binding protein [Paenibacillus radicibacter]MCR8642595.1 ABC transporter ATP-binding protein [Paenibacillus radicibacter]
MSDQTILQLRNVTKKIGSRTLVDQLTIDVPRGEVFGFLGPNGAGKTTTIRMIVGLMGMTQGEVIINGISVTKNFEQAMTQVGAIVENPEMYKFLSGYQNLIHYARMNKGITKERIEEVIKLVGLQNRIHEKVKRYSLGMRQRLGVAQAILHKPKLLILDEPTNGLDPAGIRELRDYLRNLAQVEGISVVVSSHLLSEMELMCDRVAIIQAGKLIDIRSLHTDSEGAALTHQVLFELDDPVTAIQALLGQVHTSQITVTEHKGILLPLEREQIPGIVATLLQAGINIYGITYKTKSLEEQFLEITGGEQVV